MKNIESHSLSDFKIFEEKLKEASSAVDFFSILSDMFYYVSSIQELKEAIMIYQRTKIREDFLEEIIKEPKNSDEFIQLLKTTRIFTALCFEKIVSPLRSITLPFVEKTFKIMDEEW